MPYKDPETQRAYQVAHYEANKELYVKRKIGSRERSKRALDNLKTNPCTDCGQRYLPCAMQFDHVNDNKVMSVSLMLRWKGLAAAVEEAKKCELVCANCHAVRTWKRTQATVSQQ